MNLNESHPSSSADLIRSVESELTVGSVATDEELQSLAEDIVRYCPSLTHLLLALGAKNNDPLHGLN